MEIINDIENGVKKYLALIRQVTPYTITNGVLEAGAIHTITTFVAGDDFSNIAEVISGTINTTGCVFLATDTTPTTWTNSSVIDYDGAPFVRSKVNGLYKPLINTIGDVTYSYSSPGNYSMNSSGLFSTYDKCVTKLQNNSGGTKRQYSIYSNSSSEILIEISNDGTYIDNELEYTVIEIEIHP